MNSTDLANFKDSLADGIKNLPTRFFTSEDDKNDFFQRMKDANGAEGVETVLSQLNDKLQGSIFNGQKHLSNVDVGKKIDELGKSGKASSVAAVPQQQPPAAQPIPPGAIHGQTP